MGNKTTLTYIMDGMKPLGKETPRLGFNGNLALHALFF